MKHNYLILIVGPTAVGKTELCIQLAKKYNTEIFSCDSRQFYKELSIGTAKPTKEELKEVKHHFINSLSIEENYSVGDFEKDCIEALNQFFLTQNVAIMTGGSGLFAKAITHGLDNFPKVTKSIRAEIQDDMQAKGLECLYQELKEKDAAYAEKVDNENPQRVTRALEVIRSTGKPYSFFRSGKKTERPFHIIKIGLERPRDELYSRIEKRVEIMIQDGLMNEVKSTIPFRNHVALQTVGYKESFEYIDGKISLDRCIELIKRNTRRYAKRQLTWFKNQDLFKWFNPNQSDSIETYIQKTIGANETKSV